MRKPLAVVVFFIGAVSGSHVPYCWGDEKYTLAAVGLGILIASVPITHHWWTYERD